MKFHIESKEVNCNFMNYFEDQIQPGQPIVPPGGAAPVAPAAPVMPTQQQPAQQPIYQVGADGWKGLPVRPGGDQIWLLKGGKRFWITTAEVYKRLGFNFGEERDIDLATLYVIPEGEPIK